VCSVAAPANMHEGAFLVRLQHARVIFLILGMVWFLCEMLVEAVEGFYIYFVLNPCKTLNDLEQAEKIPENFKNVKESFI
jgi:hypothetical protein